MTGTTMASGLATITPAQSQGALAILTSEGQRGIQLHAPFSQPICLIERTKVAGTTHVDNIEEIEPSLAEGMRLQFVRDPGNLHDKWAIRVLSPDGDRIGYVSCDDNQILARLMDAGKCLYGEMISKDWRGRWLHVQMAIYLED